MSKKQKIVVFGKSNIPQLLSKLTDIFDLIETDDIAHCRECAQKQDVMLIVVEAPAGNNRKALEICSELKKEGADQHDIPIILLAQTDDLQEKIQALDLGCDDYLLDTMPVEELIARFHHAIMHKIASEQLRSRLKMANDMAFMAMSNTSALGHANRFLIESVECENLDQLGLQFFSAVEPFSITCSLQMRSEFESKNMEQHGFAKDLESQLLSQLKDSGRYYDFGIRTVVNYGAASLLIKNMPVDDEAKYGSLKEIMFSFVQGLDARIKAIDNRQSLQQERDLMELLSERLQGEMSNIDESYQVIMLKIVQNVENMEDKVQQSIMYLGLSDEQEKAIEGILEQCTTANDQIFNDGLKIDQGFRELVKDLGKLFSDQEAGISSTAIEHILKKVAE